MRRQRTPFVCATFTVLGFALPAPAAKITEYPVPTASSGPYAIVSAYGDLWFTEVNGNKIGRMATAGGFNEFSIPRASAGATGLAVGDNYWLYYTESSTGGVGKILSLGGSFGTETTGLTNPNQIVAGPDGRMWFTESSAGKLYALAEFSNSPTSGEAFLGSGTSPIGIAVGPEGFVYYTKDAAGTIGYCVPDGLCYDINDPIPTANSHPRRIAYDGAFSMWFTENGANQIGRYNLFAGTYTEYPIPTASSAPVGIAAGPDGNMWFTENSGNKIGRITPNGVITEYPIPTAASHPINICLGPDGNLYFTENSGNRIGKVQVFVPGDVDGNGTVTVNDVFYLINYLFAGGAAPK